MSKRKTGHTTTKNTKKKVIKKPQPTLNQNTDLFKDGNTVVGVMCIIENIDGLTPLRFAFSKSRLTSNINDFDLQEARTNIMGDVGSLYYALKNYNKIKDTLNGITEQQLLEQLMEAVGSFIIIVCNMDMEQIESTFKTEDNIGIIFGFEFREEEKEGDYTIKESKDGINFVDYENWMINTNSFREDLETKLKNN